MNTSSVEDGLRIEPGFVWEWTWSSDLKSVTLRPTDTTKNLRYATTYTVESEDKMVYISGFRA